MKNKEKIIDAFHKVKALGWVKSHRRNNTGIGKTFEDCIGVIENNLDEPDLFGYEIKSHRKESASYVTLFTKSPSYPKRGANAMLKEKFGEYYPNSEMKKLHTSFFANNFNTYNDQYSFRLIHRPEEQRIYIGVFSLDGSKMLDCSVYYSYKDIRKILSKKLNNLLYVTARRKHLDTGEESFFFDAAEIYTEPSLDRFLNMLDKGMIRFDIRIGTYLTGPKCGKAHDHGNCFRIKEEYLQDLYSYKEVIR